MHFLKSGILFYLFSSTHVNGNLYHLFHSYRTGQQQKKETSKKTYERINFILTREDIRKFDLINTII